MSAKKDYLTAKIIMSLALILNIVILAIGQYEIAITRHPSLYLLPFFLIFIIFSGYKNKIVFFGSSLLFIFVIMRFLANSSFFILYFADQVIGTRFSIVLTLIYGLIFNLLLMLSFGSLIKNKDIIKVFIIVGMAVNLITLPCIFLFYQINYGMNIFSVPMGFWLYRILLCITNFLPLLAYYLYFNSQKLNREEERVKYNKEVNIGLMVFLSLITYGIAMLVWYDKIIGKIKFFTNSKSKSSIVEILCLMFVPFYFLYWIYTRNQIVFDEGQNRGYKLTNNSTLSLIISILGFGIIAVALLQRDLNTIAVNEHGAEPV